MSYTDKDKTDEVLCMKKGGDMNELDYEGQYR